MKPVSLILLCLISFITLPVLSSAQDATDPNDGFYGALGVTYAVSNFSSPTLETDILQSTFVDGTTFPTSDAPGLNLKLGYNITSRFDLEFEGMFTLADFTTRASHAAFPGDADFGTTQGTVFSLNSKGYLWDRVTNPRKFNFYGVGGVGYGSYNLNSTNESFELTDDEGLVFSSRLGAEYLVAPNLSLYAESGYYYGMIPSSKSELDVKFWPITLGILINF